MANEDRRNRWWLLACFALVYGYCFQGGGWNQNARLDTIRALIQTGSPAINEFAGNTGDVSERSARLYSNKPPGIALLGLPAYAAVLGATQLAGWPTDEPAVLSAGAHAVAFLTGAIPGALLVTLLYQVFRWRGETPRRAGMLAAAFGAGTLVWPYSGLIMNHVLVALALFLAWVLIGLREPGPRQAGLAGMALGLAAFCEYLVAPLIGLYALALWLRRPGWRRQAAFATGPLLFALAHLGWSWWAYGSPFSASYQDQSASFSDEGLLFGMLGWPEPIRLYWLSVHPYRGLLVLCPVLLLALLGFNHRSLRQAPVAVGLAACTAAYFILFNLSFNGWTGGWGVGPRYLIPALPFLFLSAALGWRRFPRLAPGLVLLSVLITGAMTSVLVMVPGPNEGPPPAHSPLLDAAAFLALGEVSVSTQGMHEYAPSVSYVVARFQPELLRSPQEFWDSYNLGEVLGLRGWASLLPVAALLAGLFWRLRRAPGDPSP